MVEKKFPRFCGCFGNGKSERNENGTDQNDAYEAAPQTRAPIASFHSTQDNSDPNEPSSSTIESSNNNKKHFLGLSWPKLKDRKLPQIPPKSVTFSRVQDIPHIDDPIPTYESIDVNDATYSKMDDRRNYDYPVFPHRRKKNLEENMYASASQTYSLGGSEDPYSSIASVRGANDDASVGYARVNEEQLRSNRQKPSTSSMNVDDLYAKVNRKTVQEQRIQNGLLPSNHLSNGFRNLQQIQPSTSGNFAPEPEESIYQMDESGSGSITSSGSFNPSYRYLTVRETLGVIRERMRRRNEEYNNYSTENNTSAKEHYYSTISNDYDSVRNDPEAPSTSTSSTRPNNPSSSNRNSLVMSELKINTSNPTGQFRPPPAPTSPIPQLPSQPPSAI